MNDTYSFIYNNYKKCADRLGDWDSMTKTELANGYCDADEVNDIEKKEQCYCALICKYWFMNGLLYNNRLHLEIEDISNWLCDAISKALKYRRWREPDNPLSKDINGAEKVINRCIYSEQQRYYTITNRVKNKINFTAYSFDNILSAYGDSTQGIETYDSYEPVGIINLINYFINKNRVMEALILDGICFQDSFKYDASEKTYKLSKKQLFNHLQNLNNSSFKEYFINTYSISEDVLNKNIEQLTKKNRKCLSQYIRVFMKNLKSNVEVKKLLCY